MVRSLGIMGGVPVAYGEGGGGRKVGYGSIIMVIVLSVLLHI